MAADTDLGGTFMMEMEQSATLLVRQNRQRRVKQARAPPFDATKVRRPRARASLRQPREGVASVASRQLASPRCPRRRGPRRRRSRGAAARR